jgi:hypothetical protein
MEQEQKKINVKTVKDLINEEIQKLQIHLVDSIAKNEDKDFQEARLNIRLTLISALDQIRGILIKESKQ